MYVQILHTRKKYLYWNHKNITSSNKFTTKRGAAEPEKAPLPSKIKVATQSFCYNVKILLGKCEKKSATNFGKNDTS